LTRYRFAYPGEALVLLARGRLKAYGKLAATDGDLVHVRAFGQDLYWVNDPNLASAVLLEKASAFRKGRVLDRARRLFGDGLLTSDGETHRRRRRLVGHGFHASRRRA
jgi:cytochrome P450